MFLIVDRKVENLPQLKWGNKLLVNFPSQHNQAIALDNDTDVK